MGNFYGNITLRGPSQGDLVKFLRTMGRRAYVSPAVDGCTVVFDEEEEMSLETLLPELSKHFNCVALGVINHDDDVLWYGLFQSGVLVDEYDSTPGYFEDSGTPPPKGGDAVKLCTAFVADDAAPRVEQILRRSSWGDEGYRFAVRRHQDLINALHLPGFSVGMGYRYLDKGEVPQGLTASQLISTF